MFMLSLNDPMQVTMRTRKTALVQRLPVLKPEVGKVDTRHARHHVIARSGPGATRPSRCRIYMSALGDRNQPSLQPT
jgi:hypothetical protein